VDLELSVLVRIDLDHRRVRLVATGRLTETNQRVLYPLIHHARTLTSDTEVVIDLTSLESAESAALDLLCWEVAHEETGQPTGPVQFVLTEPPPAGRLSPSPAAEACRTGSTAWTPPDPEPAPRSPRRNGPGHSPLTPGARPTEGRTMTTPTAARPTHHSALETAALAHGAAFLLVGLAGFVPGLTTGYDSLEFAGHHSQALLMGVFQVSILHNLVHLLYGIAGAVMARSGGGSRTYLRWGGAVYLVLWLYGLVVGQESPANVVPFNSADDWLHLVLGTTMVGLSFLRRDTAPPTASTGRTH
jgi:anti-anti-sigma regulatory factor